MTIEVEQLLAWQPDNFSEDHVSNFLAQTFKKLEQWHIVYYNPPHGSWKSMVFVKDDYEYRQVGPKRGVRHIKRPDLALQFLRGSEDSMILFLIEAKQSRDEWTPELITLLRAYFEGTEESKALRHIPFSHRRQIGKTEWEELQEDEPDAEWFRRCNVTYLFGFAYNLGPVNPKTDLSLERSWMSKTMANLREPSPPLVLMAIGWFDETYKPFIIMRYNRTFPEGIGKNLEDVFSDYLHIPETKSLSLNKFI